jgi:hypothetical protein
MANNENVAAGITLLDKVVSVMPPGYVVALFVSLALLAVAAGLLWRYLFGKKDRVETAWKESKYETYRTDAAIQKNHSAELERYASQITTFQTQVTALTTLISSLNDEVQRLKARDSQLKNILVSVRLHFNTLQHLHMPCYQQNKIALDSIDTLLKSADTP